MDRSCFNSVDIRRMPIRFFRKEGCLGGRCTFGYGAEYSFSMKDDVMGIEYIPLETTDSCLISNLTYLIMDDDFIFVQNGKTDQVFKFTRQGKFVCQIGRVGNGPGEYAPWTIENISLDVNKKEVFLNSRRLPAFVYSYDGEFLRTDTTTVEAVEIAIC